MALRSWDKSWTQLLAFVFFLTSIALVGSSSDAGEKDKPPPSPPPPIIVQQPQPLAPVEPPLVMPPSNAPFPSLPAPPRFTFQIDPQTLVKDLLPVPPAQLKQPAQLLAHHGYHQDLARVPEVQFDKSISRDVDKHQALKEIAYTMAKINHLNQQKTDGFLLALTAQRDDLRGLPFRMGDDCRLREDHAKLLSEVSDAIQRELTLLRQTNELEQNLVDSFWGRIHERFQGSTCKEAKVRVDRCGKENVDRALVAALMQILGPESERSRLGLAKFLGTIQHIDAIKALAKLAIFSNEETVRAAATDGLKLRREKDYTDVLMQGFRYPLPIVSKRSAEALIRLERMDLLPNLVEVLEQPDPRAPARQEIEGQEVSLVRELVRVNHHRNCLMCHAPGNTPNTPDGVLKIAVPLPAEPLQRPTDAYYQTPPASPDIVVRIDMTYLRQDFSLMMPVADAMPWPEMQRFDFLVRTRVLTAEEAAGCTEMLAKKALGEMSPYHRSALFALRELTGRDTEPTPQAWRRLLKLTEAR